MARRLPIYFLLDVSESMAGKDLDDLQQALMSVTTTLRKDPYALETAWIEVIAFAGKAKTLQPLKELVSFIPPHLPVGGGTALGEGLDLLMQEITSNTVKSTGDTKGDWRPIVYLITDGRATDDVSKAIKRWNKDFRGKATLVAISVGGQADHGVLRQLTDDVIVFRDAAPDAFAKFAKWVSQSIGASSKSLEQTGVEIAPLTPADQEVIVPLEKIERSEEKRGGGSGDERYVVLIGKCSQKRAPYLLKYERNATGSLYSLSSTMSLDEDYFQWSSGSGSVPKVNTNLLAEGASCPQCGADAGISQCGCGQMMCTGAPGIYTCPWCGMKGEFVPADGLDLQRGRG